MIKKPLRPKKQQEEPSRSPPAQLRIWLTLNEVFRILSEIKEYLASKVLRISSSNKILTRLQSIFEDVIRIEKITWLRSIYEDIIKLEKL